MLIAPGPAEPYKLMLLDCRMPGMDGFQVAERVKAGAEQGLTVLMLSSDDFNVQMSRARELGLAACLMKPVRRTELFEAIGTAMAKYNTSVVYPRSMESGLAPAGASMSVPRQTRNQLNL